MKEKLLRLNKILGELEELKEEIKVELKRIKASTKDRVYNIDLAVADICRFPQTYETLLQEHMDNSTAVVIMRRKLSALCKDGTICKTTIPGTRFGKAIFYSRDKKYYILVESDRLQNKVYCFFEYEKLNKLTIKLNDYWVLKKDEWRQKRDKEIFEGNVLKFL